MRRIFVLVALVLCLVLLFACDLGATPVPTPTQIAEGPQVLIQGNNAAEEVQTIELDNCDGKADAVRTEQRGQSVDVTVSADVAAKLGVSVGVIQAEVQTTVGAQVTDSTTRISTIQLIAPPKTRMVFQIVWSGPEQVGIVQNLKSVGVPIAFRRFSPTDVKIKSQLDIGCSGTANSQAGVPTSKLPQINNPTQPAVRQPTAILTPRTPTPTSAHDSVNVQAIDSVLGAGNWFCFPDRLDGIGVRNLPSGFVVRYPVSSVDTPSGKFTGGETVPTGGPATAWLTSALLNFDVCPNRPANNSVRGAITRVSIDNVVGVGNWVCFGDRLDAVKIIDVPSNFVVKSPFSTVDRQETKYAQNEFVPSGETATGWLQGSIDRSECR